MARFVASTSTITRATRVVALKQWECDGTAAGLATYNRLALVAARCTRGDARRGLPLALLGLGLLIGLCMARPRAAALFVAHAHNLVALYLWSSWSRAFCCVLEP